ncbi:MAG: ZIP family metal transporter [Candidatus Binatia bacterium]
MPSMPVFVWIFASGLLMSALALVGSITLLFTETTLRRLLSPLVAFAAGSLLGGAFLHMLPAAVEKEGDLLATSMWVLSGFTVFFALEQFLHWHHCHRSASTCKEPLTYLILIGDALHNFIGGLAVAGTFLIDIRLGILTWLAAAAHEVPQELGDFAVLVHGGWSKREALQFNVLSALTFLLGGIVTYVVSFQVDIAFLVPFAAGNFVYIGASDLVPEVNKHRDLMTNIVHFFSFTAGIALLYAMRVAFGHG